MSAIAYDTETEPCPIEEGDCFRTRSKAHMTVVEIVEHDHGARCCIDRERDGRRWPLWMPRADVRRRVQRGQWIRVDR